nr:restriction endonuclease subunit S [Corallococcus coralloides]
MDARWVTLTLGELGPIVTGKTPPTSVEQYFGGEIPFVTPSDMDGRRYIVSTARTLTEAGARCVGSARIPAGAVLVSCIGSDMGKAALAAKPSVTNQQINSVIVEPPNSGLYVYYDLSRRKDEIQRAAGGSAQPILNKSAFSRLPIALPPPDVQHAVAQVLGSLDDKIDLNRRMNQTLEAMAQALFRSWFVDFDPVRAKAEGRQPEGMDAETAALFPSRFAGSELGEIPEGWSVLPLDEVLVLQRGFDLPSSSRVSGPYPVMQASGMTDGHAEYRVRGPGVVTGRSGVLGNVFFVHEDFWPLNTTLWVKEFRLALPRFAYFILRTVDFKQFNAGSAVPTLNRNHVHSLRVVVPPRALVDRFESFAAPNLSLIRKNELQSKTLAHLRDLLLPRLLSGEIRVRDAEAQLAASA